MNIRPRIFLTFKDTLSNLKSDHKISEEQVSIFVTMFIHEDFNLMSALEVLFNSNDLDDFEETLWEVYFHADDLTAYKQEIKNKKKNTESNFDLQFSILYKLRNKIPNRLFRGVTSDLLTGSNALFDIIKFQTRNLESMEQEELIALLKPIESNKSSQKKQNK